MKTSLLKLTVLCTVLLCIGVSAKAQSIDELLNGYYAHNRFMGSVMIKQGDKILFQKGYGYADIANKVKNDEKTIFNLASVSKTVTAVAIMKLHDKGKLNIYDRADKYIPSFISDSTDKITIINLLNHTSGMSANIGRVDEEGKGLVIPTNEPISMENLVDKFRSSKLKDKPGQKFEYNNYGYTLLAYIVEKVSGMDFPTYQQKEIFGKIGMPNSCYKLNLKDKSAIGYSGIGSQNFVEAKNEFHPSWIIGAAYNYSNTVDLTKYIDDVFSGKLFSEKTLKLMLDTCVSIGRSKRFWTLGWEKKTISGLTFYTHSGGDFGFATRIGYLPEKNISIVVLSNLTKEIKFDDIFSANFAFVDEITEKIIKILNGEQVTYLPIPNGQPNASIAGKYKFDDSHSASIQIIGNSLLLSTELKDNFTIFDYTYYREISDTSARYKICKEFAKAILSANFEGFEQYASEQMKAGLFNPKGIAKINGGWKNYTSQSGQFKTFNICNKNDNSYSIAFHFEKAEIVMQLSFNGKDLIQGLFFQKVVPKCTVYNVSLIPVGNDEFFVDGYTYGGYNDYRVKFDKNSNALYFKSETEDFTAVKID